MRGSPTPEPADLVTVGSLFDFAMSQLESDKIAENARSVFTAHTGSTISDILEETLPVSRERLRPEARFGVDIVLL